MSRVSIKDLPVHERGKYLIIISGGFEYVEDELTLLNHVDRKGFILVAVTKDKYIFRKKGLI